MSVVVFREVELYRHSVCTKPDRGPHGRQHALCIGGFGGRSHPVEVHDDSDASEQPCVSQTLDHAFVADNAVDRRVPDPGRYFSDACQARDRPIGQPMIEGHNNSTLRAPINEARPADSLSRSCHPSSPSCVCDASGFDDGLVDLDTDMPPRACQVAEDDVARFELRNVQRKSVTRVDSDMPVVLHDDVYELTTQELDLDEAQWSDLSLDSAYRYLTNSPVNADDRCRQPCP